MKAPVCRLCRAEHYNHEPHRWSGIDTGPAPQIERPSRKPVTKPVTKLVTGPVVTTVVTEHCPTCGQRLPEHKTATERQRKHRQRLKVKP